VLDALTHPTLPLPSQDHPGAAACKQLELGQIVVAEVSYQARNVAPEGQAGSHAGRSEVYLDCAKRQRRLAGAVTSVPTQLAADRGSVT
jgi:hypothetical protein